MTEQRRIPLTEEKVSSNDGSSRSSSVSQTEESVVDVTNANSEANEVITVSDSEHETVISWSDSDDSQAPLQAPSLSAPKQAKASNSLAQQRAAEVRRKLEMRWQLDYDDLERGLLAAEKTARGRESRGVLQIAQLRQYNAQKNAMRKEGIPAPAEAASRAVASTSLLQIIRKMPRLGGTTEGTSHTCEWFARRVRREARHVVETHELQAERRGKHDCSAGARSEEGDPGMVSFVEERRRESRKKSSVAIFAQCDA